MYANVNNIADVPADDADEPSQLSLVFRTWIQTWGTKAIFYDAELQATLSELCQMSYEYELSYPGPSDIGNSPTITSASATND